MLLSPYHGNALVHPQAMGANGPLGMVQESSPAVDFGHPHMRNCVAWWHMGGPGFQCYDLMGVSHTDLRTGWTATNDGIVGAGSEDLPTGKRLHTPTGASRNNIVLEAIVTPNFASGLKVIISFSRDGAGSSWGWYMGAENTGQFHCAAVWTQNMTQGWAASTSAGYWTAGRTYHLVGVIDHHWILTGAGAGIHLYVDGRLEGAVGPKNTYNFRDPSSLNTVIIGGMEGSSAWEWEGTIHYLRMKAYDAEVPNQDDIVHWYHDPYAALMPADPLATFWPAQAAAPSTQTMPIISARGIHNAVFSGLVVQG